MVTKYFGSTLGVAATLALAATTGATYSSTARADDARADEALDSVLVTARRREEQSQDVPLAISVLDSKTIESTGTFNVGKLTQLQPSIQFYSSNPRNSAANIRGLGAPFGLTNDGIEQGVGIYVDQVYYARSAASTFDFLDVEQIEVLRGPQGTLYGKNTTAGAINITSRKPSFTPETRAEVSYGNFGFVQAKGSFSAPLIDDKLAFRVGTSYTHRDGTIYNVTTGKLINEQDNLGFKGQLLFVANDTLDLTLSVDYTHSDPLGFGTVYVRTGPTQRPANRQYASLSAASGNYAPPSLNPFDRLTDIDANLQAEQYFAGTSLLANWDIGPGTLTSVSAYRKWDWYPQNDRDFVGLPITTKSQNPSKQRQYSQELRYAASSNKIDYVVGLYGFYQTVDTKGLQEQGPLASRWLLSGANATDPTILNGLKSFNDIGLKNTSAAAFGQFTWHATDKLSVQPGLRFNYDKKDGKYIATVFDGNNAAVTGIPPVSARQTQQLGVLAPQSYQPSFSDTNLSGDFTVSYTLARDVLSYATYARSFKSGGINLSGLPLNAANTGILDLSLQTVKPETVNHYETGLKTQFLDRKITLNLSAYWTDIKDYQATVNNGQTTVIRGYLANASKVQVRGVEADFSARPTEHFSVYANGALTDGKYVSFRDAPCPPELSGGTVASAANPASPPGTIGGNSPLVCDISGQWLPGISRVAFSYGFEYSLPLPFASQAGSAYFGFDGSYRSKWSSNPSRSAYTDVDGYSLANLRAGYRHEKSWDLYGWVRNVFDKDYFDYLTVPSGNTGLIAGQPGDPRTYGVTAKVSF